MRAFFLIASLSILAVLVAACAPAPSASPTAPPTTFEAAAFFAQNCASCHGQQGWGSAIAPPLAGMPVDEIQETVRDPQPPMPSFGAEKIGDSDLAVLASYVNALMPPTLAEDLRVHLEAAKEAAENEDQAGAELHLQEAIAIAPEELKGTLEFILEEAEEGEFEEVEEFVGSLLGEMHE